MSKLGSIITSAILLATLLLLIPSNLSVRGVGEAFTLSASPGWIAEGNAAGVNMVLSVSNAQFSPPTSYVFNWTITDPSGKLSSVTNTTLSTVSSWSEVANFPKSFAGSIQLVGTYHVNVAEILPAINASVARVQFQTGLTNAAVYNRTTVVSVTGSGYLPSDPVTMSLQVGDQYAPGFPLTKNATAMGIVSF
ncbi:hypothetical protein J2P12_05775, partial [Candidatus Bathyarchaeota archaeon]|nr:hypothetical protein [Candidatus Bathyarchaeota archaeon]